MRIDIHESLKGQWTDGTRPKDLFEKYIAHDIDRYVSVIIDGLDAGNRRIENGCAELASLVSEKSPEALYPHIDLFIANLGAKEKIIRWEAVCTLGNLASVDSAGKVVPHIDVFIRFLENKSIVLQGHSLRALSKIADAFPSETMKIFSAVSTAAPSFPGNKIGFVIEAVAPLSKRPDMLAKVRAFVAPYEQSGIPVVARKAKKAMKEMTASGAKRKDNA